MAYEKKDARKDMLKSLKDSMMSEDDMGLGEKLGKMHKVTVAADSKEGLKKGLSKADEILSKRKAEFGEDKSEEKEEKKPEGCEDMSPAELKDYIKSLQDMLAKKEDSE